MTITEKMYNISINKKKLVVLTGDGHARGINENNIGVPNMMTVFLNRKNSDTKLLNVYFAIVAFSESKSFFKLGLRKVLQK